MISVGEFKTAQLKYSRVREAYKTKEQTLRVEFENTGLQFGKHSILLRAFKQEKEVELWVKNTNQVYILFKTYTVCAASGALGPKRKMGDYQVPEGYYHIDRFNPQSNFYLSLGLNYPNASDRILSDFKSPGGDIFIHGYCASIGCLAMTDDRIKEIYVVAVEAINSGQSAIPVYIYPFRMTNLNIEIASKELEKDKSLLSFWSNLKVGFDYFEKSKKTPIVSVNKKGEYLFR